jgi:hypothetical protein
MITNGLAKAYEGECTDIVYIERCRVRTLIKNKIKISS